MTTSTIIAASVVLLKHPHARICAECGCLIRARALRVVEKDSHGKPVVWFFHPHIETEDEIRGCAPDDPKVRAALSPTRPAVTAGPRSAPSVGGVSLARPSNRVGGLRDPYQTEG